MCARCAHATLCGLRPPGPGSLTTAPGSSGPGAPVDTGPGVANTQGSAQLGLQVRSLACLVSAMQQDLTPTLVPCLHKRNSTGAGVFRDVNRTALFHRDVLCGLPPQCQAAARCAGSFSHTAHKLAAAGRGPAGVLCFSVPSEAGALWRIFGSSSCWSTRTATRLIAELASRLLKCMQNHRLI